MGIRNTPVPAREYPIALTRTLPPERMDTGSERRR